MKQVSCPERYYYAPTHQPLVQSKDAVVTEVVIFPQLPPEMSVDETSKGFLYSVLRENGGSTLLQYNISSMNVERLKLPWELPYECGLIDVLEDSLVFAGGIESYSNKEVKACFILCPEKQEIKEIPGLPSSRKRLRLVYSSKNHIVIAVGGVRETYERQDNLMQIRQDYTDNTCVFRFDQMSWERIADMPVGCEYPGCCVVEDKVYAAGGCVISGRQYSCFNSIQILDLNSLKWSVSGVSLPVGLYAHAMGAVSSGKLMVFGGLNSTNEDSAISYIFEQEKFIEYAKMPRGYNLAMPYYSVVRGDEIFAISEDNVLFTSNLKLNVWTACYLEV